MRGHEWRRRNVHNAFMLVVRTEPQSALALAESIFDMRSVEYHAHVRERLPLICTNAARSGHICVARIMPACVPQGASRPRLQHAFS